MAFPYLGPYPPQGPKREVNPDIDPIGGHPTAPGPLDRDTSYPRRSEASSPGNGVPGRPRYKSLSPSHGKLGGRLPGPVPTGTQQPGVVYDDGSGE